MRAARAIALTLAVTFSAACYRDVAVRRPAAAVVAPDGGAICPRECAAATGRDEAKLARCLLTCEGTVRVMGVACGNARTPGSECATEWVEQTEQRPDGGRILAIVFGSIGAGVVTLLIVFGAPSSLR